MFSGSPPPENKIVPNNGNVDVDVNSDDYGESLMVTRPIGDPVEC